MLLETAAYHGKDRGVISRVGDLEQHFGYTSVAMHRPLLGPNAISQSHWLAMEL